MLARWGLEEGDLLELTADGLFPPRHHAKGNAQQRLDEFKRSLALEVVRRIPIAQIRRESLRNLERWRANGVWGGAYEEWRRLIEQGSDAALFAVMVGQDEEANRLRQSPPYMGLLPDAVLEKLREEAAC
jgi:hypothetical protein